MVDGEKIAEADLRSGGRGRKVADSRKLFCQLAVKKLEYAGAEVAHFLGLTASALNKAASFPEVFGISKYL